MSGVQDAGAIQLRRQLTELAGRWRATATELRELGSTAEADLEACVWADAAEQLEAVLTARERSSRGTGEHQP